MKSFKAEILLFLFLSSYLFSQDAMRIYLDADRSGTKEAGIAIERGIRLALSEIEYEIQGYDLELIIRDHHGNSRRSALHLQEFADDPQGLAVFVGLHSPPVLANMEFIQKNGLLTLDPWAAAGPITRSTDHMGVNWIFRLSIDDTKAGEVITGQTIDREGFSRPVLLLEDTGWGRSNEQTMNAALHARGLAPLQTVWFRWNIGANGARKILSDIYNWKADVIYFVGNAPEGKTFTRAMAERKMEERIPIRSHWGITGGDFFEVLGEEIPLEEIDIQFIQTSFSFLSERQTPFAQNVFRQASELFPEISRKEDIKAPCGFIHAYDLTRILISAINQIELVSDMKENRNNIRVALEGLDQPVEGLIKTYIKPFGEYNEQAESAHEALDISNYSMAIYTKSGGIRLMDEIK